MFVLAVLVLATTRAFPAAVRSFRGLRDPAGGDRAAAVLDTVVAGLPAARQEWGQAMRAELDRLVERRQRRRFTAGCVRAAAVIRARTALASREAGGEVLRLVVFAGIAAAVGLVTYGLTQYRGLRSGFTVWASVAVFLALLLIYGAVALALSRGLSPQAVSARRYGLAGGVAIATSWLLALSPTQALKGWVVIPLLVALLGPACVAALAARSSRDAATGARAALWTGIVAGLGVFVVWVTATYAKAGGPYDAGTLRDFHSSHSADIGTYVVGDNLGSGLVLLLLIPAVALAVGSLTSRLGAPATPPRRPSLPGG